MSDMKEKTFALITGGSSGIGYAYAEEWARKGYNILIVSNREDLNAQAEEKLKALFPQQQIRSHYQDLTTPNAAQELYDYCQSEHLIVEVLVNNAGMYYFGAVVETPMALSHKMTMLHCTTPADLCALFGKDMKDRRRGYIINASSITAFMSVPAISVYEATKAYLLKFSKGLHFELSHYGVKVTCVCPGAVDTDLYNLPKETRKKLRAVGIMLSPAQIAKRAVRANLHGRRVKIPGPINYFFLFMYSLMPNFVMDLVKKRFV
jgi:hypothetical protein